MIYLINHRDATYITLYMTLQNEIYITNSNKVTMIFMHTKYHLEWMFEDLNSSVMFYHEAV